MRAKIVDRSGSGDKVRNAEWGARAAAYDRVAALYHWTVAGLIAVNLPIGLTSHLMTESPLDQAITDFHKSTGLLILAVTILRLVWRITHRPPALPGRLPVGERVAAHAVHGALYVLTLAVPLTGWWMTSAFARHRPSFLGLFDLPFLPVRRGFEQGVAAHDVHSWLALTLTILVAGHVAAALRHHFILRDGTLKRMLPGAPEAMPRGKTL